MRIEPTQEQLRSLLDYDHVTGIFKWKARRKGVKHPDLLAGGPSSHGYIRIKVGQGTHYAHRLAWIYHYGCSASGEIDHINGVKADNRIENLRDVSQVVNSQNKRKATVANKTGFLGVTCKRDRRTVCYEACISVDGRSKHLGRFPTPEMAHEAYVQAKRRLHEGCTL